MAYSDTDTKRSPIGLHEEHDTVLTVTGSKPADSDTMTRTDSHTTDSDRSCSPSGFHDGRGTAVSTAEGSGSVHKMSFTYADARPERIVLKTVQAVPTDLAFADRLRPALADHDIAKTAVSSPMDTTRFSDVTTKDRSPVLGLKTEEAADLTLPASGAKSAPMADFVKTAVGRPTDSMMFSVAKRPPPLPVTEEAASIDLASRMAARMATDMGEAKRFSLTNMPPAKMFGLELAVDTDEVDVMHTEHAKPRSLGLCKVCGDEATGMYFGALVCVPCKTFFLRYAGDQFAFVCKKNRDCEITITSRTQCKFCRYQKCLMVGMCRKERPATVQLSEGQQLCVVCQDLANGVHFGAITCEGCKKFFRRGLTENQSYTCKSDKKCVVNPRTRNACRYCRFQKCLLSGMSREAIQMGRPSKIKYPDSGGGPKAKVKHLTVMPDSCLSSPTPSSSVSFSPPARPDGGNFQPPHIKQEVDDFDILEMIAEAEGKQPRSSQPNGPRDGYTDRCPVTSTNEMSPVSPCSTMENQRLRTDPQMYGNSHMSHSPNSQTKCLDSSPYQAMSSASTSPWSGYAHSPQAMEGPSYTPVPSQCTATDTSTTSSTYRPYGGGLDYRKVKQENVSPTSSCSASEYGTVPQNSGAMQILRGVAGTTVTESQAALIQAAAAQVAANVPSVSNTAGIIGRPGTVHELQSASSASCAGLDQDQSMQKHNAWSVYHVFQMAANGLFESKPDSGSNIEAINTSDNNLSISNQQPSSLEPIVPEDKDPLKMDITQHYWKYQNLPDENIIFVEDHWRNVDKILSAYDRFVQTGAEINIQLGSEFARRIPSAVTREKLAQSGQSLLPDYIEERVVRMYTLSSVKYCGEIPGFANFDLNDQYTIVRLGQSQSRILVAAIHWYDAEKRDFKDFLSWRAPTYEFKLALVNYCHKIHQLKLDKVEAALMNVLVLIATDYPDLKNPEVIEGMRMNILKSFRAYTTALYGSPNRRIEELFSHVPELRELGLHHHRMTFVTNLNGCG